MPNHWTRHKRTDGTRHKRTYTVGEEVEDSFECTGCGAEHDTFRAHATHNCPAQSIDIPRYATDTQPFGGRATMPDGGVPDSFIDHRDPDYEEKMRELAEEMGMGDAYDKFVDNIEDAFEGQSVSTRDITVNIDGSPATTAEVEAIKDALDGEDEPTVDKVAPEPTPHAPEPTVDMDDEDDPDGAWSGITSVNPDDVDLGAQPDGED